jgi:hypothetical protein
MKYGVSFKIDVKKIDKARLFQGKQAVYLDATIFLDTDNVDQYGNHGMITQDVSKEERANGVKGNILGNGKIFYTAQSDQRQNYQQPQNQQTQQNQGYQNQQSTQPQNQGYQKQNIPQGNNGQNDEEIPF